MRFHRLGVPAMGNVRALGLALLALSAVTAASAADLDAPATALHAAQASFAEYLAFLSLPSDSIVAADVQKNADFIERAFAKRGFAARQLANDGKPLVYAEFPKTPPGARTVLFYMHFDGQPVVPTEWSQPDPWLPVVKQRDAAGQWQAVGPERLSADVLDPELRVFGRCAADDKAPIMMLLAAFDALNAAGVAPAYKVKVLLDSEEERGSPSMARVARANRELLRADAIVIHDGPRHPSNRPTLVFGNRGTAEVTLKVYGPRAPLHSGHFGNYVPNPAMRLARLLASMKDDRGRVLIKGYYDHVRLTPAERRVLAETGDDEAAIRRRTGIARAESVGENYQEALQYPSLNVRGLASASVGDKAANIVPHLAIAEFDLRTTPETPPEYLFGLLETHVRRQGYHLVSGEPTDAERAAYDRLASLTLTGGSHAARTPMDSPLGAWAFNALKTTVPGATPVRIRMMGGSVPTDSLVEALEVPFVIVPLVNADNNQHTFDENLRIGHYVDGVHTLLVLLRAPY
jgi:acetylornithine deacetylase/succinyl-diaminopimelate desuccinylase-like protein